jgi:uncharacterized membrane protein
MSRSDAQQRADDIRVFARELARLEQEGVVALTQAQRDALAAHHRDLLVRLAQNYDIDSDSRAKQLSLGMRIASFLGALALAASVFFLFHQFWDRFSTAVQVVVLIGAALGTLGATVFIQGRDPSGYFTKLAAMVAFACFAINIALLGHIFNITPTDRALIPWAAYALLLAYACDLRLLLAAGILCIIAWISARTGTFSGMYWLHFGERPENFFPAALILFLVPQLIPHARFTGFGPIYRVFALLTLFLSILILSNWGRISYLDYDPDVIEGAYQLLGFGLSAGAIWLGARRGWGEVVNTGATFFVIFLYTKFFDWWWEIMPKYLFFLVLGLTAVLLLFIMRRLRASGLFGGSSMKTPMNADERG